MGAYEIGRCTIIISSIPNEYLLGNLVNVFNFFGISWDKKDIMNQLSKAVVIYSFHLESLYSSLKDVE